ncbi:Sphingoid long-chain base transporter RSB1 [Apiospora hydei]|uniref:Sphingoid long-chain base transporter RSB1 n=1 Tax=Apiospora hydei TaxID=1337664 RepID=A0ABR1UVR3_9PEZI
MVSASDFTTVCNTTILDTELCTPQTCCLSQGWMDYIPTLAGNVLYAVIFGLLILPNVFFTVRARTWSFGVWMTLGLIGEIVGYIGRIMLNNNIFSFMGFLTYLVPLTIAPAFITASMYLCLARLIHIIDPALQYTRLKPMMYTWIFVTFDFIALILQGAGGGITATGDDNKDQVDLGVNVMMAGLGFQVFSLVAFSALCGDFTWRVRKGQREWRTASVASTDPVIEDRYRALRTTLMFRGLIGALVAAVFLIIVRSVYRLAELQGGFHGKLANNEVVFMIIEGPMVILACAVLIAFHPGLALKGYWDMKGFTKIQQANVTKMSVLGGYGSSTDPSQVVLESSREEVGRPEYRHT